MHTSGCICFLAGGKGIRVAKVNTREAKMRDKFAECQPRVPRAALRRTVVAAKHEARKGIKHRNRAPLRVPYPFLHEPIAASQDTGKPSVFVLACRECLATKSETVLDKSPMA